MAFWGAADRKNYLNKVLKQWGISNAGNCKENFIAVR